RPTTRRSARRRSSASRATTDPQLTPPRSYRFVHIRLAMQGDEITEIRVGGSVVPVLEGELRI
ncbi:MAG TPA: hypothetical protein VIH11_07870, partial [Gemmatimonadaceae bacterium]